MHLLPPHRPLLDRTRVYNVLRNRGVNADVSLLGVRGYYSKTMGNTPGNEQGIYDDAIFIVSTNAFAAFNANTDPSIRRQSVATLECGSWKYQIGIHGLSKPVAKQYPALVQADEVTVSRDGEASETGFFGINIHRGGYNGTSSLGCQTIYPDQWEAFFGLVKSELARRGQRIVPYLLIEAKDL
jgi:hypothetical protein